MTVAIYSRGIEPDQQSQLYTLLQELQQHQIQTVVYKDLAEKHPEVFSPYDAATQIFSGHNDLNENIDCIISLGGDGTILDSATLVKDKAIPILGINFGRLGFLASIGKEELSTAVDALVHGTYVVDKRSLIHVDANMPIFEEAPFGLNEFVIHKRDLNPMIKIHTYLNGEFLNTYWADGLIVSTPTGSTGYNMSCGGPIVFPESGSFVITPIAPHNLNVRPIVIPDSTVVSFEVEGRGEEMICNLDARRAIVSKEIQLAIKREQFEVSLVRLNEGSFLSTLRSKLTWGYDKRN
jgi:NAD+ kinase